MFTKDDPINLGLISVTKENLSHLVPTTSMDIFDGGTTNFNENGLFSTLIYGQIGDSMRDRQFSYADLHIGVMHPLIFRHVTKLKSFYKDMILGKAYGVWDDETKSFLPSNPIEGKRGYASFMSKWDDIKFPRNDSTKRDDRIDLIETFHNKTFTKAVLILPAGLRDVEEGKNGNITQDESNDFYRRLIATNNLLRGSEINPRDSLLDQTRLTMQTSFNNIYDYFENILKGKRGFLQNKVARRAVFNGTGNVVTVMNPMNRVLGASGNMRYTDTLVSFFQAMKAIQPVTIHLLMNSFVSRVFGTVNGEAMLVNKKTLEGHFVPVHVTTFDRWMSPEGLLKVINSYETRGLRDLPVTVEDKYYMGLIYKGEMNGKKVFKLFSSIKDLPKGFSRDKVTPVTLMELLFIAGYAEWNKYPATSTRYPIATLGSTYPTTMFVKPTTETDTRYELDDNWEIKGEDYKTSCFPRANSKGKFDYFDSMAPHPSRLAAAGTDFDGDKLYLNAVYTEEAKAEILGSFKKRATFVNLDGSFRASMNIPILGLILSTMTGD